VNGCIALPEGAGSRFGIEPESGVPGWRAKPSAFDGWILKIGLFHRAAGLLSLLVLGVGFLAAFGVEHLSAGRDGERRIALYNIHTKETLDIVYMRDGKRLPDAMQKINWLLRDWRENEPTTMDPELVDLLWEIRAELGTQVPTHVISGFRSPKTNSMLRKTRGGQATKSQHILGKAMDIQFPDVPLKRLRYSALIRERGGVGYYPTSALPFVHIDTGRTRHWPRMPRYELALLFPDGKSRHVPSDGRPITYSDVKTARAKYTELAVQIAQFHEFRNGPTAPKPTLVASGWGAQVRPNDDFMPKLPQPVARAPERAELRVASLTPMAPPSPQPVTRPEKPAVAMASNDDRQQLASLFALASLGGSWLVGSTAATDAPRSAPEINGETVARTTESAMFEASTESRLGVRSHGDDEPSIRKLIAEAEMAGWSNGFASAPAFDEEHPDELFYRPFPLAPLMTSSSSPDDPALATMQHPDVLATLDLLDEESITLPMRFTATQQVAEMLFTQQFKGSAINPAALQGNAQESGKGDSGLSSRSVRTSMR